MRLDFSSLANREAGRDALAAALPPGTPRSVVEETMRSSGARLHPQGSGLLCVWEGDGEVIRPKWIVSFAFDPADRLQRIGANYGVVAP